MEATHKPGDKKTSDIKRKHFYKFYRKHGKTVRVEAPIYNAFLTELLEILATNIVLKNEPVHIPKIGTIRVITRVKKILKQDGSFTKRSVDWKTTKEYWATKYPGLTPDELKQIKNKIVIYYENETNEMYTHLWHKNVNRWFSFFDFKPSRQYSRLIAKVVKDPNRNVFYYG